MPMNVIRRNDAEAGQMLATKEIDNGQLIITDDCKT
jgi:hypothetical protein